MLFPARLFDGLRSGEVTVAFRAWKRPSVKAGGTLQTPAGVLAIEEVEPIGRDKITVEDARAAGADSVEEVLTSLRADEDRTLYRIRFHHAGEDPRIALRSDDRLDVADLGAIGDRLARWDRAAADGPWTSNVLAVIAERPATVSTELAGELGMERAVFKQRVRRLKSLGLTESLQRGYRLSPRGEAYLSRSSGHRGSAGTRGR